MKYWWITDNSLITHVRLASYISGYLIISRQSKSCCRGVHISPVLHISSSSSTSSFSESSMNPQRRDVILLLFQNQNDQLLQIHEMLARRRRRRRGRQARNVWVRFLEDQSRACMIGWWWSSAMKTQDLSRTSCACLQPCLTRLFRGWPRELPMRRPTGELLLILVWRWPLHFVT